MAAVPVLSAYLVITYWSEYRHSSLCEFYSKSLNPVPGDYIRGRSEPLCTAFDPSEKLVGCGVRQAAELDGPVV